jgi:hypothetical protein
MPLGFPSLDDDEVLDAQIDEPDEAPQPTADLSKPDLKKSIPEPDHMDVSHLFEEAADSPAPNVEALTEPSVNQAETPDTIMDVELVEDDDSQVEAKALEDLSPPPPPPPIIPPAPEMQPAETFMVPKESLLEANPADSFAAEAKDIGIDNTSQGNHSYDLGDNDLDGQDLGDNDLEGQDLGDHDLGEHDLGSLDQDTDNLVVDGTEFADVDNLLDDLDDEE